MYTLEDADSREIFGYHWHPGSRFSVPHLHLEAGAKLGRAELQRAHFPTGRISVEEFLRLVIEAFDVRIRRKDWRSVLQQAHVQVAPHNASGPIGTAAAVQLAAAIPNFLIQEYFVAQAPWIEEVVAGGPRVTGGEIVVPDRPGLGVELHEAAALAHPFEESWGGKTLFTAGWQAGLPDRDRLEGPPARPLRSPQRRGAFSA